MDFYVVPMDDPGKIMPGQIKTRCPQVFGMFRCGVLEKIHNADNFDQSPGIHGGVAHGQLSFKGGGVIPDTTITYLQGSPHESHGMPGFHRDEPGQVPGVPL